MKITQELLQGKGASSEDVKVFLHHFPSGEADYQDVLNQLAAVNNFITARWLLKNVGKTDTVLEEYRLTENNSLFFAGAGGGILG